MKEIVRVGGAWVKTIHVAVVDDEAIQIETMTRLIQQAEKEKQLSIEIHSFSSGEEWLFELEDHKEVEMIFLDIEMKQVDGLEVAKKIREKDSQMTIVFVTGFAEYAVQGYEVEALDYLLKPIELEKIVQVFERHLTKKPEKSDWITLETDQGILKLALDEIIYIEANKRQCEIHLTDEIVTVNKRLKDVAEEMNEAFIQTHRSYVVNVKHINRLMKTDVECSNKDRVPVSRRLAKEVQEKFVDFHKGSVFYDE